MKDDTFKDMLNGHRFKEDLNSCPGEAELADYLDGAISAEEKDVIAEHIASCSECFKKISECEKTFSLFEKNKEAGPAARIKEKAKMIAKGPGSRQKATTYINRNKFLFISAGFFTLSFIFKGYFAQFIAMAVVAGFKWVMDTGGSKALVMIYDTWKVSRRQK